LQHYCTTDFNALAQVLYPLPTARAMTAENGLKWPEMA
jgi:hypothetical protein